MEIFDWNQIEQAKSLGLAKIELAEIEPFQAVEQALHLTSERPHEKGQIRVRLLFQPEIIAKSRKNTSTFSVAGRAMTHIGSLPVGAGKGVLHGVTGVFKKDKDGKHREEDGHPPVPDLPAGQASQPVGQSDTMTGTSPTFPAMNSAAPVDGANSSHEPGTLRVTVLDAKDLATSDIKPYVTVRVGDKEFKTKHSSKTATPEWSVLLVVLAYINFIS